MRHICLMVLIAMGLGVGGTTFGITYNFEYVFNNGLEITGNMDGDKDGDYLKNISNVSVYFNGSKMVNEVVLGNPNINSTAGAVVSFDVTKNNFVFANAPLSTSSFNMYFRIFNSSGGELHMADAANYPLHLTGFDINQLGRWVLEPANAPDGGCTVFMLTSGLLACVGLRRMTKW